MQEKASKGAPGDVAFLVAHYLNSEKNIHGGAKGENQVLTISQGCLS
jgi:hypothetical protein